MNVMKTKLSELTHSDIDAMMSTLQKISSVVNDENGFTKEDQSNFTTLKTALSNFEREQAEERKEGIRRDTETYCVHKMMIYSENMCNYVADAFECDGFRCSQMLAHDYWGKIGSYVNEYLYGKHRDFDSQESENDLDEHDME